MIRRDFLKTTALATGALLTPSALFANDNKISIAILGTGWWGTDYLLPSFLTNPHFEVVALCDVNPNAMKNASAKIVEAGGKQPALFSSYQQLYEMPGLQAVVISTPTHWHALQFIAACKKGLHVFLEKPISYDIREGQAMMEAHRKAKNIVVVDFPRTMVDTNQKVRALIQGGEIGKVYQVQANIHNREGDVVEKPIPSDFNFDAFCGPAPKTKYLCTAEGTTPWWRGISEFSRGILNDWGIHYIHNARLVMGLDLPVNVSAIGGVVRFKSQSNPDQLDVRFDFGDTTMYWTHKCWGYASPDPTHDIGVYYFGEKGTIFAGDLGYEIMKPGMDTVQVGSVIFDPGSNDQIYRKMFQDILNEFAEGIRKNTGAGITNTLEQAYKTTSTVIYGDVAYRSKSNLAIDKSTMDITNNKAAYAMLKREYRSPYQHPFKG